MIKGSYKERAILPIKKPAVLAAKYFYDFTVNTAITIFDSSDLENIAKERIQRKLVMTTSSDDRYKAKQIFNIDHS